jgi:taurine dioxygenase
VTLTVRPCGATLGADVEGIDMRRPLDAEAVAAIEQAFLDHRVLRFHGPVLSPRELSAFSAYFGNLQPHVQRKFQHPDDPNVVEMRNFDADGKFDLAAASRGAMEQLRDGWHSDLSYDAVPAKATLLHALEIPSRGGNTCFTDTHAAYAALPEAMKQRLAGLRAEFSYGANSRNKQTNLAASSLDQQGRDTTTVVHPVVCVHPVTRRPALYANPLIAVRILEVSEAESDAILDELFEWIDRPEFRWEHEWRVGDTLMWENRGGVMHCGRLDYPRDERRQFIRTTVRGQAIEMHRAE